MKRGVKALNSMTLEKWKLNTLRAKLHQLSHGNPQGCKSSGAGSRQLSRNNLSQLIYLELVSNQSESEMECDFDLLSRLNKPRGGEGLKIEWDAWLIIGFGFHKIPQRAKVPANHDPNQEQ